MKIKFNWGTGILITIILFVSFFISFIIFSLTQEVNLVTKNYFNDEIAYDKKINKIKNTNKLKEKINFLQKNKTLIITYPENSEKIEGKILLYYIKSYKKDKTFNINPDNNGTQKIDLSKLKPGRYIIKTDWTLNDKNYYQEKIIEIK